MVGSGDLPLDWGSFGSEYRRIVMVVYIHMGLYRWTRGAAHSLRVAYDSSHREFLSEEE